MQTDLPIPPSAPDAAQEAAADKLADILLAFETIPAPRIRLTPMASGDRPIVAVRVDDRRWTLTPAEVRTMARCLTWEGRGRHVGLLASLLEGIACDAEALACPVASARRAKMVAAGAA